MSAESEKLQSMMGKIKNLLARADHPNTPGPEADSCRAKAEDLMKKYRVNQEHLIEAGDVDVMKPVSRSFDICPIVSPYSTAYLNLWSSVLIHVGAKGVYRQAWSDEINGWMSVGEAVGFEADLAYAEILFTSARLVFGDRMEPKIMPELSDQENVYRLRRAGMERIRIAEMFGWVKGGAKVTRLYKAECEKRGEDPVLTGKGINPEMYRKMYAESFVTEFYWRLDKARNAAEGNAGTIVLGNRDEMVKEAYYTKYPHLRPDPNRKPVKFKERTKAQRDADERKWLREMAKRSSASARAGSAAGERAAKDIDLGGTKHVGS